MGPFRLIEDSACVARVEQVAWRRAQFALLRGLARSGRSALVASHLAQLDHQVAVGLALHFLVRRQCTRRGRQAVPLLRKALRTSGSGPVAQGPRSGPAALPAVRVLAVPQTR